MQVDEFLKHYPSHSEAAQALGVSRMTLWNWRQAGGEIPDPWVYKAVFLLTSKAGDEPIRP